MKITRKITRTITEEEVDDILCNKCGRSCKDLSGWGYEGLLEAYISGGYGSKIGDGVGCEFSLCETCLLELFEIFKFPPKFLEYGAFSGDLNAIAAENSDEEEETKTEKSP